MSRKLIRFSLLSILLLLLNASYLQASYHYAFNTEVSNSYQLVTSLRFNEAYKQLNKLKISQPDNLAPLIVEDYIDFLALMISEDNTLLRKLSKNKDIRLARFLKYGDTSDPYHLFLQAEIYMHWAAIDMRFGNYFSCIKGAYNAYKLLQQNQKLFPNFIPNDKNIGLFHVLIGTIPDTYRSSIKLLTGMDGTIDQGLSEIQSVINYAKKNKFLFADETKIMYAFLLLHIENQPENAWKKLVSEKIDYDTQPLLAYVYANAAFHTMNNDICISILEKRNYDAKYFKLDLSNLLLGRAKLNRLDKDANIYLSKFLQSYKGKSYLKEANMLLNWYYTIFNNPSKANLYRDAVIKIGSSAQESDKSAIDEMKLYPHYNPILLSARVLFDGAYSEKALNEISKIKPNGLQKKDEQLEYYYRKGRIFQQMKKSKEAKEMFQQVLINGKNEKYYFACNAALQMGTIYEDENQREKAKYYFQLCLDIEPNSYANSLHVRAKAGLQRIKSNN